MKIYKYNNYSLLICAILCNFVKEIYSLSVCTSASNICTITKGQSLINEGKYCIEGNKIYIGKDSTGKCELATIISKKGYYFFKGDEIITNADSDPDSGYYCISNNSCTEITENAIYINELSPKNVVSYNIKGSSYSISISRNSSFLTNLESPLLIECDLVNGCITKNYGSKNSVYINGMGIGLTNALIMCKSSTECNAFSPKENTQYKSSTDDNGLIKCSNSECTSIPYSSVIPNSYYINSGIDKDSKHLIFCDSKQSLCETIKYKENYLKYDLDPTSLIHCVKNIEKNEVKCSIEKGKQNYFYLNGAVSGSLINALISCDSISCVIYTPAPTDGYYLNGNSSSLNDALIHCNISSCLVEKGKDDLFYLNGASTRLDKGLIYCSKTNLCSPVTAKVDSFYLSGTVDGLNNALIYWDTNSVSSVINGINNSYYINTASTNSTNALINCHDNVCSTINETKDSYYITKSVQPSNSSKEIFKSLIYCNTRGLCNNEIAEKDSYYLNRAATVIDEMLIYCEMDTTGTSGIICKPVSSSKINSGYYLNSGRNSSSYPLITCDKEKCDSLKIKENVFPGYYINAGDSTKPVIICDQNCYSTNVSDLKKIGGYVYSKSILGFYYNDTITPANVTTTTSDLFYDVKIPEKDIFPSINNVIKTVFKVSKYSITRYSIDGILSIGSDNKLTTNNITLGATSQVYSCNKESMTCTKIISCITDGFYLDITSKVGYYCDSNTLTPITKSGYYIDSSRYVNNNTPYLMYCNIEYKCTPYDNPYQYYLNAGINYISNAQLSFSSSAKNDKNLIYCNGKNCNTLISSTGYYLAGLSHVDIYPNRLIYCTDNNACNEPRPISIVASFINNGIDKYQKPLIYCDIDTCKTQSINTGYFLSENQNKLIYCETNSCKEIKATSGYYYYGGSQASKKYLIKCETQISTDMICEIIEGETGFYVSTTSNVLINCVGEKCKSFIAKNGIFRSAIAKSASSNTKRNYSRFTRRTYITYNLIICNQDGCHELSTLELAQVPICSYLDDKCYIVLSKTSSSTLGLITDIDAGGYCTSSDRSQIYFATGSITLETNKEVSELSVEATTKNCLAVGKKYSNYYYIYGDIIYKLSENSISQVFSDGYFFINTNTNMLASVNDIDSYNDEKTKLYKCNDNGCSVVKRPETLTYFTDVNKKIIKYDPVTDRYSFMRDITCIYSNDRCTPNANMNDQNVCITYKGELVLTSDEIISHETGNCYKSNDIDTDIYGYSNNLYLMNSNSAHLLQNTSYFFINSLSHTMANYRDFTNGKSNSVNIYGCLMNRCMRFEPEEGIFYYNPFGKYLIKYENGVWTSPKTSGYALVSINPSEVYIYKFSVISNTVTLENKVHEGFYYTIDEDMYECTEHNHICEKISESGYYFTASDEMYYCLYDSEHVEKTSCYKQNCTPGQYYFIEYRYHRCEKNSFLHPVSPLYCFAKDKVIINFPIMYKNTMPNQVKKAIDNIELHNNSTSVIKSNNINNMNIVPGIFTNCTYNKEEDTTKFDLVCISNYVEVDDEKDAKICSIEHFGFINCEEDKNNPEKCHASLAYPSIPIYKMIYTIIIVSITYLLLH
ncbi:scaffoldin [Piromyces sp. E2]|nr:scaffoldin [Piromyces sp. E2]|eukprot:OUM68988.1 scaffoldin [Piromyces sp. E2]